MNIISITIKASAAGAVLPMVLLAHVSCHTEKPIAQTCIQHINTTFCLGLSTLFPSFLDNSIPPLSLLFLIIPGLFLFTQLFPIFFMFLLVFPPRAWLISDGT